MTIDPDKLNQDENKESEQTTTPPVIDEPSLSQEQIQAQENRLMEARESEENAPAEIADLRQSLGIGEQPQKKAESEQKVETQEDKDKLASEIMARAQNASSEIKERAEGLAEEARRSGSMGIEDPRSDLEDAIKNNASTDGIFAGWSKKEAEDLYQVLYGEKMKEPEESPKSKAEKATKQMQEAEQRQAKKDALGRMVAEAARQKTEENTRKLEEENQKRIQEQERQKVEVEERRKAEEQRKNSGLFGRLFRRGK